MERSGWRFATRRVALVLLAAAVVATAAVLGVRSFGQSTPPRGNRPNILIIVTDDQRAAGTLGVMPETRRLFVRGGRRFTSAFVTTPFCCPSRASILTGQYAHNHGIHLSVASVDDPNSVVDEDSAFQRSTIERSLQDAGYKTALFGKYLNQWPIGTDPPYFDDWAVVKIPLGVSYSGGEVNENGTVSPVDEYNTRYVLDRALDFVDDADDSGQPWFMYLGFKAPHTPYTPEARYRGAPVGRFTRNPAVAEQDLADKPAYVPAGAVGGAAARGARLRAKQLRTLMSVDDAVGTLFRQLARLGEDRRTLAVFTSDNGLTWGEHGFVGQKDIPYTSSVAVPLLLRWPGHVRAGTTDRRLAENVDIAPTVLAASGLHAETADGRSLLGADRRRRLLLEAWAVPAVPTWASLRTRRYQYVEYYKPDEASPAEQHVVAREYYDLRSDPWELENVLHAPAAQRPPVAALSRRLSALRECRGSACP